MAALMQHEMKEAAASAFEAVPCNICGGTDHRVVYPAADRSKAELAVEFRSSGDEPLRDRLVACVKCGLQFVSPRLRGDVILNAYQEGTDEVFVSQAAARENTFERALAFIEGLVPHRGALLDIGTAGGSFLHVAARRGWKVAGCEPNRWLCEWGKTTYGLDIQPGTIFDHRYPDHSFDVVTAWDVLEHAPDPMAFLRECRRVLKPGGLMIVNCPDIGSWIARVMGKSWPMLLSTHLYYFTRGTLKEALHSAGFAVDQMRPHYQWLELAYLLKRSEPLAGPVARSAKALVSSVGLSRLQIPYWIGQTLVVARKPAAAGTVSSSST
jgi:2-polyprenyl-3-methyl-5-hydroxy-6-metoxy-1,4-benzoquinol methylase